MIQKKAASLIAAGILFVIALFGLQSYMEQQRLQEREQARQAIKQIQANQTSVLVAKQAISRGTQLTPDLLDVKVVLNDRIEAKALTSLDRAAGMVASTDIAQDEQITFNKLLEESGGGGESLANATPIGKRAVTINVDDTSAVGGMIKPGDHVDVIGVVPVPVQLPDGKQGSQEATLSLFQNVLVLAVGQQIGRPAAAIPAGPAGRYASPESAPAEKSASGLITLALSPQEVNFLTFVQEQGKMRLVLRSPADPEVKPLVPASWDSLFQYVLPQTGRSENQAEPEPAKKQTRTVEVFRGFEREEVPLGSK